MADLKAQDAARAQYNNQVTQWPDNPSLFTVPTTTGQWAGKEQVTYQLGADGLLHPPSGPGHEGYPTYRIEGNKLIDVQTGQAHPAPLETHGRTLKSITKAAMDNVTKKYKK